MSESATRPDPVLLYDGLCALCDGAVGFVLAHDRRGLLRFAPLQGDYAAHVMAEHPELASVDSLILIEPGGGGGGDRVRVRSDAALAVAREMGGAWGLLGALRVIPRFVRDAVYDWVARNRFGWFGRRDACRIPTAEERARFVD